MPSGVMSFAYARNENGNITAENSARYTYDDLNRLTSWYDPATDATTTYTFDAECNLTSDGNRTYAYDELNRLTPSPTRPVPSPTSTTTAPAQTSSPSPTVRVTRSPPTHGRAVCRFR
jgi:YD repeat-containing protein